MAVLPWQSVRRQQMWLLLPAVAYLVIFLIIPIYIILAFGFLDVQFGRVIPGSWTLRHYIRVLADPFYYRIFARTLSMGATVTLLCLLFGYPVAYLFTRVGSTGKQVLLAMVLTPVLTNAVVRTYGWMIILGGEKGLLNNLLLSLGIIHEPVRILYSMNAVIVGLTQILLPFMILPTIAALEKQAPELQDAAAGLGASWSQAFFHITLPLSLPGILTGCSLVFVLSFANLAVPMLLGGGSFGIVPVYIFEQSSIWEWNRAAVLSSLLLASSILMLWGFNRVSSSMLRWTK